MLCIPIFGSIHSVRMGKIQPKIRLEVSSWLVFTSIKEMSTCLWYSPDKIICNSHMNPSITVPPVDPPRWNINTQGWLTASCSLQHKGRYSEYQTGEEAECALLAGVKARVRIRFAFLCAQLIETLLTETCWEVSQRETVGDIWEMLWALPRQLAQSSLLW